MKDISISNMPQEDILDETAVTYVNGKAKKPNWLRVKLPTGPEYKHVRGLVNTHKLHTICESGNCPNMGECWGAGTATFMILGNICTRSCGFCAVATGRPGAVDWDEPQRVAEAIHLMKVKHAVITSVDRDDLKDGGSIIWANTIKAVKALNPNTTLETLIPDFKGNLENVQNVIDVAPEVISHNVETVERLTRKVRIQAKYHRSLEVIRTLHEAGVRTKSGIMLGLGELKDEVLQTMQDLKDNGCDVITIGQYLQPSPKHLPVVRFVHPDEFALYREEGYKMGIDFVESGPLVRSSYHSEKHVIPGYGIQKWKSEKELNN
ncbi:MAG TPA: lipoyl synthase [Edaphocola sp.]|nr:lipoyl synthase [Edaphocola sp.]